MAHSPPSPSKIHTFDDLDRMNSAAVAAAANRETERITRLHAEHMARAAAARALPRKRGGVPGWVTWCVLAPLTLACPPLFAPLLVLALAGARD